LNNTERHLNEFDLSRLTVDGFAVGRALEPETPAEVADILATAASAGEAVIPVGGGTLIGLGNPPERADVALSTRRLSRILAHEPADLTLSVEAGVTLSDLQAALGEQGQWLPIEGPLPAETTIGGLIATAFTSPRKFGSDGLRDLLVGISVAHPTGAISKAGGTVVKNVTGFDMMRLYHGSLGTLGLILSANFKVLPRPRAEATWRGMFATRDESLSAASKLLALRGRPVALEILSTSESGWELLARYEGRELTVALMVAEATGAIGSPTELSEHQDSAIIWQRLVDRYASGTTGDRLLIRATCRPRETPAVASIATSVAERANGASVQISPGLGRVDMEIPLAGISTDQRDELLNPLEAVASSVAILDAPPTWKAGRDVWGTTPETLDLMQALKNEFDPQRVINPGRFAGSI
jgi:glycolate oxidase FAD binding subunit